MLGLTSAALTEDPPLLALPLPESLPHAATAPARDAAASTAPTGRRRMIAPPVYFDLAGGRALGRTVEECRGQLLRPGRKGLLLAPAAAASLREAALGGTGGEQDGRDDHDALDDLLVEGRDAHEVQDVGQDGQQQRAGHRSDGAAGAAHEARPADHDRGDRVELGEV